MKIEKIRSKQKKRRVQSLVLSGNLQPGVREVIQVSVSTQMMKTTGDQKLRGHLILTLSV